MLWLARWLVPVSSPPVREGGLLVRDGTIVEAGPAEGLRAAHPEEPVRDLGAAALLPGFVNAHSHVEITGLRRALAGLPFAAWIPRLVRLRREVLEPVDDAISSELGAAEAVRAGVTCLGDCTATGAPAAALRAAGLRGVVYQEAFALTEDQAPEALRALRTRLAEAELEDESRVRCGLSPHSPYTAAPDLLRSVAALAAETGRPLSIHVAESQAERDFLRDGTGPIGDDRRARGLGWTPGGLGPVEHLAAAGWLELGVPVQLVHACRAGAEELDLLAEHRDRPVPPVLTACPRSNLRLGNGAPSLAAWSERGLPWGLGTDGAPAAGTCDPLSELRLAARLLELDGRPESPRQLLARATLEAARALGLATAIGSLEPGKRADACAISLAGARFEPDGDPEAAVVDAAGPADVVFVAVDGEPLLEDGRLVRHDEERLAARARERARRLDSLLR
jgi:5-methylthioadenosine/S-adenosylhomocysteine deaminase